MRTKGSARYRGQCDTRATYEVGRGGDYAEEVRCSSSEANAGVRGANEEHRHAKAESVASAL